MSPELQLQAPSPGNEAPDVTEPTGFLKKLGSFLKRPETFTPLGAVGLLFGLYWFGPEIIEKNKTIKETVRSVIASGFEPPPTQEIDNWIVLLVVAVAAVLFLSVLSAAVIYRSTRSLRRNFGAMQLHARSLRKQLDDTSSERDRLSGERSQLENERDSLKVAIETERNRVQTTLDSRRNQLRRTLGGTVNAASRIRDQFFPPGVAGGGKNIEAVHLIYYIRKNLDAEVRRRYLLRAGHDPLHFWQSKISVSSEAAPIESLADIDYRLTSHDIGKDVVYLLTHDETRSKAVCIFFLPRVEPAEARDIEASYHWPGMFLQLKSQGWDKVAIKLKNPHPLKRFQMEIYLEPGSRGTLACSENGIFLPNKTLEALSSHHGWPGWRYTGSDIPAALLENEISLKIDWIPA